MHGASLSAPLEATGSRATHPPEPRRGSPEPPAGPYLVGLEADGGSVPAVGDEVLAVVPEQAVGRGSHQLLRPPGRLLAAQHPALEEPVHVVDQDAAAVGEVLHRVHADAGRLGDDAQDEPLVGHHALDLPAVGGDGGQDVGHQVGDAVLPQVDAEVDEEGAGHLQQVPPLEAAGVVVAGGRRLPARTGGQGPEVGEEQQLLQQQRGRLRHRVLLHGQRDGALAADERPPPPGNAFLDRRAGRGWGRGRPTTAVPPPGPAGGAGGAGAALPGPGGRQDPEGEDPRARRRVAGGRPRPPRSSPGCRAELSPP